RPQRGPQVGESADRHTPVLGDEDRDAVVQLLGDLLDDRDLLRSRCSVRCHVCIPPFASTRGARSDANTDEERITPVVRLTGWFFGDMHLGWRRCLSCLGLAPLPT